MKFFAKWQPPVNEDAITALTFGFFRHAPAEAMNQWLSEVLGRRVTAEPLNEHSFWPQYQSRLEGHHWTEPELVFDADDGQPFLVVVEAKPGYNQHSDEQVVREIIDTVSGEKPDRLTLIMVGADLGPSSEISTLQTRAQSDLKLHAPEAVVSVDLRYSSWAQIGEAINACGARDPAWKAYSDDVCSQLLLAGLLGYKGAPMFDDLDGLSVTNAVVLFNRTVKAARLFFLSLHADSHFQAAGLVPYGNSFAMIQDGTSTVLTQDEDWFETSVLLSLYRKPNWPAGAGVFAGFWLNPPEGDHPELQVGGFVATDSSLVYAYADAEDVEFVSDKTLRNLDKEVFDGAVSSGDTEWVFASQEWKSGTPADDIKWTLDKLLTAANNWDTSASPRING